MRRRAVLVLGFLAAPSLALAGPGERTGWLGVGGGLIGEHDRMLAADAVIDGGVRVAGRGRVALDVHARLAVGEDVLPDEHPLGRHLELRAGLVGSYCTAAAGACGLLALDGGIEDVGSRDAVGVAQAGVELGGERWRVRTLIGVRRAQLIDDRGEPRSVSGRWGEELTLLALRRF